MVEIAQRHNIAAEVITQSFEFLVKNEQLYPTEKSYLLHNDYGPDHIFYENGKISGIIDFEVTRGGDPIQDFARWDFYYSRKLPISWLMEGYTNKTIFDANFSLKVNLYKLLHCIEFLYYHDKIGNLHGIELDKRNFAETLSFLNRNAKK